VEGLASVRHIVFVALMTAMFAAAPSARAETQAPAQEQARAPAQTPAPATPGAPAAPATPAAPAAARRHGKYPMKAADYQHAVEGRVQHARERLESRITHKKLTPDRAHDARIKFDSRAAEVRKVVSEVAADGVVTREEARRVNESTRALARATRVHK
jgi:hypothetical protein